jgi:hypothetical protein
MAESIEAADLAARLRRLADDMRDVGEDMVDLGGFGGCMAEHGVELIGAAGMALDWAEAIHSGRDEPLAKSDA